MWTAMRSGDPARSIGAADPSRPGLSRDRIIAAAIEFVDKRSLTALTMRRPGKELGVEAMSLYRYVNGREDLLGGMLPAPGDDGRPGAGRRPATC